MVKVVVTAKKSLRILDSCAEVQALVGSEKEREHLLTPKLRCWSGGERRSASTFSLRSSGFVSMTVLQ